ncbi:hypothetical protein DFH28DRAFT_1085724 [Melampsora americana]|nr:hypothetical protein DFH28DRAFT_1085724 [Melampsora americana]
MVVPTLIKDTLRMVNPGAPLPIPRLRGPVGLHCPVCSTPMIYKRANTDSWLIGCPTPDNDHHWRTWRCDQLNHELALINLGEPRPIISNVGDWGPRVSPTGEVLLPAPEPQPGPRYHPFLNRPGTSVATPNGRAPRSQPLVPCKRPLEGPIAQSHKTAANKECPSQYCLGCCLEYGSPLCRKHARPSARSIQPFQTAEPFASRIADPILRAKPRGTAFEARPHQWAQASNSLGRRVPQATMAMLQNHREQREHAAQRQVSSLIDESKLVTIDLWLNPVEPKRITALFPTWPKACFGESPLLVQALQSANGPNWNQALIFWDEKINAWRDTLDSYPHRFSVHQHTILVRLPSVEVPLSALPSAKKVGSSKAPVSTFLSSSDLPPIYDQPSSPQESSQTPPPNNNPLTNSNPSVEPAQTLEPSSGNLQSPGIQQPTTQPPVNPTVLQSGWPSGVLVSTLVEWNKRWGGQWKFVIGTMYRYRAFVKEVDKGPISMGDHYRSQPQATVADARMRFHKEFKIVAKLHCELPFF